MQLIDRNLRRSWALLGVGALLLLALAVTAVLLTLRQGATFETVVRDRELRRAASALVTALRDVEVGQRGYLLTGDPAFLEPYEAVIDRFPELEADLARAAAASDVDRAGELAGLTALVEERLAVARALVVEQREGRRPGDAALLAEMRRGKAAMDQITGRVDGFLDRTAVDFRGLLADQARLGRLSLWATLLAFGAMVVVVGAAFATMARQLRALSVAEAELTRLNQGLEERVQERTEDLIRANGEVQRFATIVTHDLRAPLVNVMGFTSELEESLKAIQAYVLHEADGEPLSEHAIREARQAAAEDLPEALGFIRASTRKMDGLINAILKISRDGRRELRPQRVDLAALAQAALDAVAHQIAETGGEAGVEAEVGSMVTDRLSLEQALGNLVDNAVKYADPSRPLRLTIRTRPEGRSRVRVEVEDNGRGIAEADRDRVFELFRRAGRQDRPGEGIGLAHVRTLVRNLGGEITLRSREGQGSVFALDLPADLRRVRGATAA